MSFKTTVAYPGLHLGYSTYHVPSEGVGSLDLVYQWLFGTKMYGNFGMCVIVPVSSYYNVLYLKLKLFIDLIVSVSKNFYNL